MTQKTKQLFCVFLSALVILFNTTYGQDTYESKQFGIKMLKPDSWIVATNSDLQNNLDKIKFTEEELQKVLNSNKGILTLASYYKYRIDSVSGFIPTIKVTVRANPTTNMPDFKQVMIASTDRLKTVVKNFEYIDNLQETSISGLPCLLYSCRYSLPLADGSNIKVRNRYYMIPKGSHFISISLMDNETTENCSQTFDVFIKSLQLTK